jgi:hypothetical protein
MSAFTVFMGGDLLDTSYRYLFQAAGVAERLLSVGSTSAPIQYFSDIPSAICRLARSGNVERNHLAREKHL